MGQVLLGQKNWRVILQNLDESKKNGKALHLDVLLLFLDLKKYHLVFKDVWPLFYEDTRQKLSPSVLI